jgi:heme A synthase
MLSSTALVAVMIQGLLGGFRVKLNELVGTDLAAVHGVFAQVVFCLLIVLAVLTEQPASPTERVPDPQSRSLRQWSIALAGLLFVQVIWGAMIRHDPTPLTQRLHFLTAFLALAVAVWVLRAVFANAATRTQAGWVAWLVAGLLVVQLCLGVEA